VAHRLHKIERERLAPFGIRVDDPKAAVEPNRLAGEDPSASTSE
jgi:hypothetical protein